MRILRPAITDAETNYGRPKGRFGTREKFCQYSSYRTFHPSSLIPLSDGFYQQRLTGYVPLLLLAPLFSEDIYPHLYHFYRYCKNRIIYSH